MTTGAGLEGSPLWQAIQTRLAGEGFEPLPARRLFVRRRPGALYDVVGLRMARGQLPEAVVYFAVWAPEMDDVAADPTKDQRRSIKTFASMPELSPVAPLKNSYWWPLALTDAAERSSLQRQLGELALPYFDSVATPADLLGLLQAHDDSAAQAAAARLSGRAGAAAEPGPAIVDRVATALLAAGLAAAGFARNGELLWRQRGERIDILVIDSAADGRFVELSAVVWHQSIAEGIDGEVPQGVTLATARALGGRGADTSDPLDTLWFAGASPHARAGLAELPTLVPQALAHFDRVVSRADVLAALPEAYRPYFPRS